MAGIPVQLYAGSTPIAASKIGQLITAPFSYDSVVARFKAYFSAIPKLIEASTKSRVRLPGSGATGTDIPVESGATNR